MLIKPKNERLIISKKHHLITLSDKVREICSPLFATSDVTFFDLTRVYEDGKIMELSSNGQLTAYCYGEGHYLIPNIPKTLFNNLSYYYPIELATTTPLSEALIHQFNAANTLLMFHHYPTYIDIYDIRIKPNCADPFNYFINNLDNFFQFSQDFKYQANSLISIAERNKISPLSESQANNMVEDLFQGCTYRSKLEKIPFSQRQLQCLQLYIQGKTAKEIAKSINLSYRTVENYLQHIKLKLRVHNKAQLIHAVLNQLNNSNFKSYLKEE